MTLLIVANGDIASPAWLAARAATADVLLAADGGLRHLAPLGVWPTAVIGDLDSIAAGDEMRLAAAGTAVIRYPRAKDETDLELALQHAAKLDADPILVAGAFGGRVDQMLANIQLLALPALAGRRVELISHEQRLWLVRDESAIDGEVGDTVSLLPLGGPVVVAATRGLRWPLTNVTLAFGPARGVSNEIVARPASVRVADGQLLCVLTRRDWDR